MKSIYFILFLLILCFQMEAQNAGTVPNVKSKYKVFDKELKDSITVYSYVEVMPIFPGGDPMLLKFIASNINYPQSAKMRGLQGECLVQFVIDTLGKVKNVRTIKNVPNCPQCDEEAVRVVAMLPMWKPGKMATGELVNVFYVVPIKYILRNDGCF
jgi:periplasmic protein TonB